MTSKKQKSPGPVDSLLKLPPELMTEVFKFVGDQRTITRELCLVSRRFRDLVVRNTALQSHLCHNNLCRVGFDFDAFTTGVHILRMKRNSYMFGENMVRRLSENTTVHTLQFQLCQLYPTDAKLICRSLINNTVIHTLIMSCNMGYQFDDAEGAGLLKELLRVNTTIRHLDISINSIDDSGMRLIAEGFASNITLEYLNLNYNRFGIVGLRHFIAALDRNTTLRELCMGWSNGIRREGINLILDALMRNSTIQKIAMNCLSFDDANVTQLVRMLRVNTTLRNMDLNNTGLGSKHVARIAEVLEASSSLCEIDLREAHGFDFYQKTERARELRRTMIDIPQEIGKRRGIRVHVGNYVSH